jgi:hypothetical protein
MSLISPQRSLSPERSTKSVRFLKILTIVTSLDPCLHPIPYSSYVSGLEDRLEKMEALLKRVRITPVCQHHALLNPNVPSPSCVRRSISPNISAHPSSGIPGSWMHSHQPRLRDRLSRENGHPTSLNPLDHSLKAQRNSSDAEPESCHSSDDDDPPFECAKRKLNSAHPGTRTTNQTKTMATPAWTPGHDCTGRVLIFTWWAPRCSGSTTHKGGDTAGSTTRNTSSRPRNVSQGPSTDLLGSPFSGE